MHGTRRPANKQQKDCKMKKAITIVVLAAMAGVSSFAELPLFTKPSQVKFDGLFGVKFGERMPSNVPVVPSPDGTLLTEIEPKEPEFVFHDYFACILPKTYVVVGFVGVDTFQDDELEKCSKAYNRCRKAVEARFGKKMAVIPPTESGVDESQTVLSNCGAMVAGNRFVMLQSVKEASGGYIFRLIALDLKASKSAIEQFKKDAASISPLEGLFGRRLGEKVSVSPDEEALAEGWCVQVFEPEKKFLDFDLYIVGILPKSRKTGMVAATKDFDERFEATECFTRVCQLLEKKFRQKMTDASSNFDATKPDEDGEQIFKASAMTFPNSWRYIEVHCLKDVDDKVFRVSISAYDQSLVDSLDSETKTLKREESDKAALDAL